MQAVTDKLRNFLQFVAVKLIDEPAKAQLKVAEIGPKKLRFKLVLAKEDDADRTQRLHCLSDPQCP